MDTTKTVTHVSLCAGYGGIDIGLKRAIPNLRTVAFSEIEGFACANLVVKMEAGLLDAAPVWTNLKTFPWQEFRGRVDILSGGYPCQPFSSAGKRKGADDPRHLWPFIADGIRLMQPRVCFFENVEGHISLGLRAVIEELGSIGYETTWGIFSAREVGAPHQRKRVFIMAYSADWRGKSLHDWNSKSTDVIPCRSWPTRPGELQQEWEPPRVVANSKHDGLTASQVSGSIDETTSKQSKGKNDSFHFAGTNNDATVKSFSVGNARNGLCESKRESSAREKGEPNGYASKSTYEEWLPNQPSLGRDADGIASGMDYAKLCITCDSRNDELRLLGNGVVPATATKAFLTLLEDLIK